MDEDVKAILGQLARAINDGIERAEGIGQSVKRLEEMGYSFSLYLEATILLSREGEAGKPGARRAPRGLRSGSLRLSDRDLKFLKSLKIAISEKKKP